MNNTDLMQLRRMLRSAACAHTAGRSLTIDLALLGEKFDPAYLVNRSPIEMWAQAFWDSWVPRGRFVAVWHAACMGVKEGKGSPWSKVRGPGGAVLATMKRIGWEPVAMEFLAQDYPTKIMTHRGPVDLLEFCPKSLGDLVDEATQAWLWKREAQINPKWEQLKHGACIEPLVALVKAKDSYEWGWLEKGMLLLSCMQEQLIKAATGAEQGTAAPPRRIQPCLFRWILTNSARK